jgi:exopolyphosphatase/guanosine-5'-triphosphate,3'-diphosphate pyrophosphatase
MVAIDLGSNSIRGVEWDCSTNSPKKRFEKVVRTAEGLEKGGRISAEAVQRVVGAIEEMKKVLDFSDGVKGVATEALRRASNGEEVLAQIEAETGVRFEVITPEEEGLFTAIGIQEGLKRRGVEPAHHFLAVDVGGGSTEFILVYKTQIVSNSYPWGIVTLSEKYRTPERIALYLKRQREKVRNFLQTLYITYKKPKLMVGSGGTPTTIAALKKGLTAKTYDPEVVTGTTITIEDLDYWYERLLRLELKKREELVGVGRGDLIGAGILILKEALKSAGFTKMVVTDEGVREGVAVVECRNRKKGEG